MNGLEKTGYELADGNGPMAELADALSSNLSEKSCGFNSLSDYNN